MVYFAKSFPPTACLLLGAADYYILLSKHFHSFFASAFPAFDLQCVNVDPCVMTNTSEAFLAQR